MKILLLFFTLFLYCCLDANAQFKIEGRIMNNNNVPLPNANIITRDGFQKARTDSAGYFRLSIATKQAILVITHIGYESREVPVHLANKGVITVILQPLIAELREISISTGYQTIPKERATGSSSTIDNKTFNQQVSTDVLSRLEAIANSLKVNRTTLGSSNNISIRGLSTFSGPSSVLIIVDNFPYEGDLNNINPNDVENITILKDAAAASIWGARAGNGVIVITTKRGKLNQPIKIDFTSNLTLDQESNLYYLKSMSSADYIDFEKYKFSLKYRLADTSNTSHPSFSPVYEILLRQLGKKITDTQANNQLADLAKNDIRQQYQQYMYKPGLKQQYALNLSGGTATNSWYFSSGYDKNRSELDAVYNRLNINFQNTYKPFRFLTLSTGLIYTQSNTIAGKTGYDNSLEPYSRLADDQGNAVGITKSYRKPYLDTLGAGKLLDWNYYPLTDDQHISNTQSINSTIFNAGVNYAVFKWMNIDVKYQYEKQKNSSKLLHDKDSYFSRSLVNQYSQIGSGQVKYIIPAGGVFDVGENELNVHNLRTQLNINYNWAKHEIYGLVGAELRDRKSFGSTIRRYGYNADLNKYANYDPTTTYPNIVTGTRSLIPG
ncbi:MAG: TonB-dependent receptor plug domain-containing protein, partial [Mucilaginibacter sp.]|uniref:TonB-dependent receptor plug domain-containing protein n=1 Tax=Mucilaginibacter sp. TaxID=1882438 RepID=UPI003267BEE2